MSGFPEFAALSSSLAAACGPNLHHTLHEETCRCRPSLFPPLQRYVAITFYYAECNPNANAARPQRNRRIRHVGSALRGKAWVVNRRRALANRVPKVTTEGPCPNDDARSALLLLLAPASGRPDWPARRPVRRRRYKFNSTDESGSIVCITFPAKVSERNPSDFSQPRWPHTPRHRH